MCNFEVLGKWKSAKVGKVEKYKLHYVTCHKKIKKCKNECKL